MMSVVQRRLVVTLVLVAIAVAGVLRLRQEDDARRDEARRMEQEGRLFDCEGHGALDGFSLFNPRGRFDIEAVWDNPEGNTKTDKINFWQITAPTKLRAETLIAEAIVEATCGLRRSSWAHRANDKAAFDPSIYNLKDPPFGVTLHFRDGYAATVFAGDKSAFNNELFVSRKESPAAVALVDGAYQFQLDKDLFALRDKKLVHLEAQDISEVGLTANLPDTVPFKLSRDDQGFSLVTMPVTSAHQAEAPEKLPADKAAADALLSAVSNMRAKSFVAEQPTAQQLAHYGLSRPRLKVLLRAKDEPDTVLRIGQVTLGQDKHYFCQSGSTQDPVAELPSDYVVDKLLTGAQSLRDMRLFHLDVGSVEGFSFERGDKRLDFVRRASTPNDCEQARLIGHTIEHGAPLWYLAQDSTPLEQADVSGLLYRLVNVRAESQPTRHADAQTLAQAGLNEPVWTLSFTTATQAPIETLSGGRKEGMLQLVTDSHQQVISRIFAAVVDDIDMTGASFKREQAQKDVP